MKINIFKLEVKIKEKKKNEKKLFWEPNCLGLFNLAAYLFFLKGSFAIRKIFN